MPMTFKLNLTCSACKAAVTFENEKPEWKEDPKVAEALAESKAFVERHKDTIPFFVKEEKKPPYVMSTGQYGEFRLLKVDPRYVECPCCGGRAWWGSGKSE